MLENNKENHSTKVNNFEILKICVPIFNEIFSLKRLLPDRFTNLSSHSPNV